MSIIRKRWYAPLGLLGWLVGSFLIVQPANAIYLDDEKTIQLSGVFYNQVRLRTEEPRGLNTKVGDWNLLLLQKRSISMGCGSFSIPASNTMACTITGLVRSNNCLPICGKATASSFSRFMGRWNSSAAG